MKPVVLCLIISLIFVSLSLLVDYCLLFSGAAHVHLQYSFFFEGPPFSLVVGLCFVFLT